MRCGTPSRSCSAPPERAEGITVAGPEIVGVRLTQAAYAHGLALALPENVEMARPTGFERADAINIRIPVEGAEIGLIAAGA